MSKNTSRARKQIPDSRTVQDSELWSFSKGLTEKGREQLNRQLSELARVLQLGGELTVSAVEEALDTALMPPVQPNWRQSWYNSELVPDGWFFGESLTRRQRRTLHEAVEGLIRFVRSQDPNERREDRKEALNLVKKYLKAVGESVPKRKRKRRQSSKEQIPLTSRQSEVVHIVAECKGNMSEAARRLGLHRKTVAEHYNTAMKKMGIAAIKHRTQSLPLDRRGQATIEDGSDLRRR